MFEFTVYGEPKGKERPRFRKNSNHPYTPNKTMNYERAIKKAFMEKYSKGFPADIYIGAEIKCYYPIPKSTTKKKRALIEQEIVRPLVKPDVDNVLKITLDALNGVAYSDDKQIVNAKISKWYGDVPRIEVRLYEVKV